MSTLKFRKTIRAAAALTFVAALVFPTAVSAENDTESAAKTEKSVQPPQEAPTAGDDGSSGRFSLEHRRELYRKSKLSPWAAAGWTMLLPGLGNLYARQYLLAGLGFVSFTFSGSFLAYGIAVEEPVLQAIGWSFAGIAYGGGMTTSIIGVHRFNRHRRQSLGLDNEMAEHRRKLFPQQAGTAMSVRPIIFNLNFRF